MEDFVKAIEATHQRIKAGKKKAAEIRSLISRINSMDFEGLWNAFSILEMEGIHGTVVKDLNMVEEDYWAPRRIWFNCCEMHQDQGIKELFGTRVSKGEKFSSYDEEIKALKKVLFILEAVMSAYNK